MKKLTGTICGALALAGTYALATGDYFGDVAAHTLRLTVEYPIMDYNAGGQMIEKNMTASITLTNGSPILSIPAEKYTCVGKVTVIMYNGITKEHPREPNPHGKLVFTFRKSGWGDGEFITQMFEIPFTADPRDKKAMLSIQTEGTFELRNESELAKSFNYTTSPEPVPCHIKVQETTLGVMNKLSKNK